MQCTLVNKVQAAKKMGSLGGESCSLSALKNLTGCYLNIHDVREDIIVGAAIF